MTTCWTAIPDLGNIERYLKAIEKFPMLTHEEELATANEGELGKTKLVLSHLRLAVKLARTFVRFGFSHDELISEATMGLVRAANNFEADKGRFSSWATRYISSDLMNYTVRNRRMSTVATTKSQRKLFFNLPRMRHEKLATTGRSTFSQDDIQKIASSLDVKPEEVMEMDMRLRGGDVTIDPMADDEDNPNASLSNHLTDGRDPLRMMEWGEREWLESEGAKEAVESLNEREAFIIKHRYMVEDTLTLHDLAPIFGVSAERIRQLEVKALKTMREYLTAVMSPPPMEFFTAKAIRVRHLNGKPVASHLLKQAMETIEAEYA